MRSAFTAPENDRRRTQSHSNVNVASASVRLIHVPFGRWRTNIPFSHSSLSNSIVRLRAFINDGEKKNNNNVSVSRERRRLSGHTQAWTNTI